MQKSSSSDDQNLIDRSAVFTSRLNSLIGDESVAVWADRHGLNPQTLYNLKGKLPGLNLLLQIQSAAGCSLDWLLGLSGDQELPGNNLGMVSKPADTIVAVGQIEGDWSDFVRVPMYAVKASAGHGAFVDQENIKYHLAFRRKFIQVHLQIPHHNLYCVEVDGVSMEPVLRNGHPVLIEPYSGDALREGPYLLRLEGTLLLKNIQRLPGRLRIWSENQTTNAYQAIEINWPAPEGTDFQILGRVRWSDRIF